MQKQNTNAIGITSHTRKQQHIVGDRPTLRRQLLPNLFQEDISEPTQIIVGGYYICITMIGQVLGDAVNFDSADAIKNAPPTVAME